MTGAKDRLRQLLDQATVSRLSAGTVYEWLGMSRFKQRRTVQQSLLVMLLMEDLGWRHVSNGTRPYFAKRKEQPRLTVLKRVSNETDC
jgi:hypothetical protein